MDTLKNMNAALRYIENNLDSEIDYLQIAKFAGTSEYHFRRLFSYLSGMSLNTYIRNRKLSQASLDLQKDTSKVIDIAVKYGYHSADGFTRAFKEWSGINPSEVKKAKNLKLFPQMTFQLTIRGGTDLNYRIEKKEAFKLVGISKRVPIVFEGQNPEIIKLIQSITKEQKEKLQSFRNTDIKTVVQASYNFDSERQKEKGNLDHLVGSITTLNRDFSNFEVVHVPECTWAIFTSSGPFPQTMQDTWSKIASEWLPSSNYELADVPEISFTGDLSNLEHVHSEIWIGVKEKN
ncbi:AraC family transcriptional regulator [Niallia sp. NCCP-28]|uniref:AraC family transcriptional regulator n=1 Tax=Niallia sp. NCCP-28 TaxID=2934712 RepID=UPI00208BA9C5|nr:AraC family transcriptional regulator [Niallia sp. NCCP-28]GKU83011.1 putative HTH-type transcriptional regulator YdeE [Niallia sp. NCCP-28]